MLRWQDNIEIAVEGSRMGRCESDEARLRIGTSSGFLQTSIKCGEFVDQRRKCVVRRARNHVVGW